MSADFDDLLRLAREAVGAGQLTKAREHYQNALARRSDSVEAHYGLASVCYLLKDLSAAAMHFQDVLRLDPLHAGAAINLGALCNVLKEYEEAIKHLRRGIQLDPARGEGYYNLGIAYRKLGRHELAIQAYREAQRLNPRMVEACYNLANVYFEMGRLDQASFHYRRALEINPKFERAAQGLARAEKKIVETKRPLDSGVIVTGDIRAGDPIEQDHRLDRHLDPVSDRETLSRIYLETEQTEACALNWASMTEKLDAAIRDLSRHLTSRTPPGERQMAMARFRETLAVFRATKAKFEESFDHLATMKDAMIQRG